MNNRLLAVVLVAIGASVGAADAFAAQITSGSSDHGITLIGGAVGSLDGLSSALTGLGLDPTNTVIANFSSSVESYTAAPPVGGLFTVHGNTGTFVYRNP